MADNRRFTGTYHDDGTTDCSAGNSSCQYENDGDCFHCGHRVREHVDDDGSYILVEPIE